MTGYEIRFNGNVIGRVVSNRSLTEDEICEYAGVNLIRTEEDLQKDNCYYTEDLEFTTF